MRSLLPKINILRIDLGNINSDVLALTETWLKPDIADSLIYLSSFRFVGSDRLIRNNQGDLKTGGGLIIYYKSDNACSVLLDATMCTIDLEAICIALDKVNMRRLVILNIYRPPTGSVVNALSSIAHT